MLTGPHLRVRVHKKTLSPSFVAVDKHRERAEALIDLPSNQGNVAQITPGRAESSYLWLKMAGRQGEANGRGARMPRNGVPLSPEELQRIALWINALADE